MSWDFLPFESWLNAGALFMFVGVLLVPYWLRRRNGRAAAERWARVAGFPFAAPGELPVGLRTTRVLGVPLGRQRWVVRGTFDGLEIVVFEWSRGALENYMGCAVALREDLDPVAVASSLSEKGVLAAVGGGHVAVLRPREKAVSPNYLGAVALKARELLGPVAA